MLTREFKLKWWNKFNFDHICQELQKNTSSSKKKSSNFFLENSQVQDQLASVLDRKQLKKQLLEAASQISDDEDDTVLESSSPNYRTHPEAFQDSQDPYDMRQIRRNDRTTDPLGNNYDRLLFISTQDRKIQK